MTNSCVLCDGGTPTHFAGDLYLASYFSFVGFHCDGEPNEQHRHKRSEGQSVGKNQEPIILNSRFLKNNNNGCLIDCVGTERGGTPYFWL